MNADGCIDRLNPPPSSGIRTRTLSMAATGFAADIRAGMPADACMTIPFSLARCGNRAELHH